MTFWKFTRDHFLQIIFWLLGLLLFNLVIWLDPSNSIALVNLLYLDLLLVIFLAVFLFVLFWSRRSWYRQVDDRITDADNILNQPLINPQRCDERQIARYSEVLLETHQQVLNSLVNEQADQREFIDSWVHDIKVPLAALRLVGDSLEDEIGEQKYDQLVEEIDRMNHYVEEVLYYSRLSHFANDYLIQEYSLKAIINPVVRDNMNYFIHKKIRLERKNLDYTVLTDQKWLSFIIQQIIANSLKYTPPAGEITIAVVSDRRGLDLQITDTGVGIPEADLSRIFDKGFTGANGRHADTHATGLGLYLAQKLAQKLGHQISVCSTVGVGTTLTIHFPLLSYYNSPDSQTSFLDKEGEYDD
ncbi:sensor histidine kinase [Lapidilactobacillus achengensis]|uniref:histidine kinase n=1 Tax=Lapidilactobacillus achengensis TaxID=2486000 RepID=A0ABW1UKA0_9LACO|nr:sensor histidine kinase [Lapidilactobacillus achengensis]